MEGLIVALAVTLPLIGLFVMLVYLRRMENTEKLSMIEKGVEMMEVESLPALYQTVKGTIINVELYNKVETK